VSIDLIRFDSKVTVVAITGGPSAGKSTFLARAREWLEARGLRVVVLHEMATELIQAGFSPVQGWESELSFQTHVLERIVEGENSYYRMLMEQATDHPCVLLCDRGALDAIAYIGKDRFEEVLQQFGVRLHRLRERYSAVVHLVTAAKGAEEFYTLGNNAARTESPGMARHLDELTMAAWYGHQHLSVVDNSTDFEEKMRRALSALARVLNMPEPLEIERKFLVRGFQPSLLPPNAVVVEVEQTYLLYREGVERRVRRRTVDGVSSFYYTEKQDTGEPGTRVERERQIDEREYETFLGERDLECQVVRKRRYSFVRGSHHFEVDVYEAPVDALVVLEVEVRKMDESIDFPPTWNLMEVTTDPRYSNHAISAGSLSQ
jgi:CYTH domain-containing protein/predicted ATPase